MSKRKPYNRVTGYVAMRKNPYSGGFLIIYQAALTPMDVHVHGLPYAVLCDVHVCFQGFDSLPVARIALKYPDFCEACATAMREAEALPDGLSA